MNRIILLGEGIEAMVGKNTLRTPFIERLRAACLTASVPLLRFGARRHDYHALFAAPGGGNMGDQAMADVFCEHVAGDIRVLLMKPGAVIVPRYGQGQRRGVVIEDLMSKNPVKFGRAFLAVGLLLRRARSLSITGADIMDGGYNEQASLLRWRLARVAQSAGIPTRILGFSWNGRASDAVAREARRAARSGVDLLVRDPVSRARMAKAAIGPTRATSDSVFALSQLDPDTDLFALVRSARVDGARIAVLNASALVAKRVDQPAEYAIILGALREQGYLPVLVPHVNRGPDGDVRAVREVAAAAPGLAWQIVDELLRPAQIRALLSLADVVVTGRMHLGIMSLSLGVPAFVISTQGKVEGLADLFESPELVVAAEAGLGDVVAARIAPGRVAEMKARITSRLSAVTEMAQANFDSIGDHTPAVTTPGDAAGIRDDSSVSVIIPTHNRPQFLATAVGAALAQSRLPLEVIVSSDVPDPEAEALVAEIARTTPISVRFTHDPQTHGGASASRNGGARLARGDVLAFLDDDDEWDPRYLETAISAAARTGAEMAVVGRWMVRGSTRVEAPLLEPGKSAQDVVAVSLGTTGSNMVMTRRSYLATGGFDESIPVKNDTDFFFRFLLAGHRYESVPERLVFQTKHGGGQLTGNSERRASGTKVYMAKHAVHLRRQDRRHLRLSYYRIRYHLASRPVARYSYLALALLNYSPKKYLKERSTRRAWLALERGADA